MKNGSFYVGAALAALFVCFASCGKGKGVFTPTSSALPYEIIVVVDPGVWERPAGRSLFNVLDSDVQGLPQSERSFKVMYTSPQNYDATLKMIRNIVVVDIQDIYTQAKFKYAKDVYASPQLILNIQAPNEKEFQEFVEANGERILDLFTKAEMNRQIAFLEKKHNDQILTQATNLFGCQIWLPAELIASKTGKDFLWASTNAATADQNFVMYSYPYTNKNTFTKEYFIHKRDSVMKVNMPGAKEGMYMTTDSLMTDVKPVNVHNTYTLEARGLWRMKGDFMGGPFVSHSRVDQVNGRIITVEIFVYSPDRSKGNLVRRMEASLYTLKLPGDQPEATTLPSGTLPEEN